MIGVTIVKSDLNGETSAREARIFVANGEAALRPERRAGLIDFIERLKQLADGRMEGDAHTVLIEVGSC